MELACARLSDSIRSGNVLKAKLRRARLGKKVFPKPRLLNRLSHFLPQFVLLKIFKLTILRIVDYGTVVWLDYPKVMVDKLERFQNYAMRSIDRFHC